MSFGEAEYTIGWSYSYGWSVTTTESNSYSVVSATIRVESLENLSRRGSLDCHIPSNSVGQVWHQEHMAWADYQFQDCKNKKGKTECGAQ